MAETASTTTNLETAAKSEIVQALQALNDHHLTVNFTWVAVVVAFLALFGFLFYRSSLSYEKALATAEAHEQQYQTTLGALENQLKADQQQISVLQQQKAQVQTQIVYRDKQADTQIATVQSPSREASQVANDVQTSYGFAPDSVTGDVFTFGKPAVQTFVATKIDRDRLSSDNTDVRNELSLSDNANKLLANDLQGTQAQLKSAQGVIDGYKKVAKKGFWRRAGDVAMKVAYIAGGIAVGRAIK